MTPDRRRAAIVIALVVVCSALAGAAVERVVAQRVRRHSSAGQGGAGRGSPEQDARRRSDMLDEMTKSLELSATQRAGLDSVMQHTDSSLRAIRAEMQPRIKQVFQRSRADIEARLDSTQRIKFAKSWTGRGRGPR